MSRLGILGATTLSLSLAIASPAFAQQAHGGGMRGGGMHVGGGGMHVGGGGAFRGAQASMGAGRVGGMNGANFAGRGNVQNGQFAQGGFRGDRGFRDHDRGFGAGAGFVGGLAAGSALGYGYDPYYYGDDYAYNDTYDNGYDVAYPVDSGVVVSSGGDASYCAQRYRSYDPASGTYLGFDGLRHPCL